MSRAPKILLAFATCGVALLDWMAGSTIAEPDGRGDTPPDEMVPAAASLENGVAASATVGRLAIRVLPDGGRYVLEATNPATTTEEERVTVTVHETTVNPMARMGPMPREAARETLALRCAPGQTVRRVLTLAGLSPATPLAPTPQPPNVAGTRNADNVVLNGLQFFTTREIFVSAAAATPAGPAVQRENAFPQRAAFVGVLPGTSGQPVLRQAVTLAARIERVVPALPAPQDAGRNRGL